MKTFISSSWLARVARHWSLVLLFSSAAGVVAQNMPDIVWSTNAYGPSYMRVAFSPDGTILACAGRPPQSGQPRQIDLWRVADGGLLRTIRLATINDDARFLSFWPDGASLVAGGSIPFQGDGAAKVWHWRVSDGALLHSWQYPGHFVRSVAFSTDSERRWLLVAVGDGSGGELVVLQSADYSPVAYLTRELQPPNGADTVAFAPVAKLWASGHHDGSVKLWTYTNGFSNDSLLQSFPSHSNAVRKVAFLPGGELLLSVSDGGETLVRKVSDGSVVRRFGEGDTQDAAVSSDGQLLLTKAYAGPPLALPPPLRFWRVADGALLKVYDQGTETADSVAFSPDPRVYAFAQGTGRVAVARMPVIIDSPKRTGSQLQLQWNDPGGLYQLQQATNPGAAAWVNFGPATSATSVTVPMTNRAAFFRVQSLTNAP